MALRDRTAGTPAGAKESASFAQVVGGTVNHLTFAALMLALASLAVHGWWLA